LGGNPGALALPSAPAWSLVLASGHLGAGLDPVDLRDLKREGGRRLPDATRDEWLRRIREAGREAGSGGVVVTPLAVSRGPLALQLSVLGMGDMLLNGDAAELLLFGNAGRTGQPGEFQLEGSFIDGAVFTTLALGGAIPLSLPPALNGGGEVALGAALTWTQGNLLLLGRDGGSGFSGDPVRIDLRFPVVQTDPEGGRLRNGGGVGVDLGLAWERGPWSGGIVAQNVVNSFRWDPERLRFRPGEALLDPGDASSDFDTRPYGEAPAFLREEVEASRFRPRGSMGVAYRHSTTFTASGEIQARSGRGIGDVPRRSASGGVEVRPFPRLPLRGGVSWTPGGTRLGGGAGVVLGDIEVGASLLLQRGSDGSATHLGFGVTANPRP